MPDSQYLDGTKFVYLNDSRTLLHRANRPKKYAFVKVTLLYSVK